MTESDSETVTNSMINTKSFEKCRYVQTLSSGVDVALL